MAGGKAYVAVLRDLLRQLPDLRLDVHEHAMNGPFGFSRWTMHATGTAGPFAMAGTDRTRVRHGLVCENYIFFDTALFGRLTGGYRYLIAYWRGVFAAMVVPGFGAAIIVEAQSATDKREVDDPMGGGGDRGVVGGGEYGPAGGYGGAQDGDDPGGGGVVLL